ncbi:hypothetical protein BLA50215_07856 [Burkholderia lata]|nr:hypothetical protein BLA50215_07856 [Burkholderia lata]
MDLQWQRQVELWLRLMGAPPEILPAPQLSLRHGRDTHYLEAIANRALVSLARPLPEIVRQPTLLHLMTLLQPEAGGSVPLRVWLACGCLWLAATAPEDSGAELWSRLAHQQRRLLDRAAEHSHEA